MAKSKKLSILALATAALLPSLAAADVFKCKGADGKVAYTDRPCPKGSAGETVVMRGQRSAAPVEESVPRECVAIAQRIWQLQSREVSGALPADAVAELGVSRRSLDESCNMRLAASELSYRCTDKQAELTAATAAAADPAQNDRLVRVQGEYNTLCADDLIEADIRRHLRPSREPRRVQ